MQVIGPFLLALSHLSLRYIAAAQYPLPSLPSAFCYKLQKKPRGFRRARASFLCRTPARPCSRTTTVSEIMSSFNAETTSEQLAPTFAQAIKGKHIVLTGCSPKSLAVATAKVLATYEPARLVISARDASKYGLLCYVIATLIEEQTGRKQS